MSLLNFGDQFRKQHQFPDSLKNIFELDTYAKYLQLKVNKTNFDDCETVCIQNKSLTKQQIDYLQLKLNIFIHRLTNEKIEINPFLKPIIINSFTIKSTERKSMILIFIFWTLSSILSFPIITLSRYGAHLVANANNYILAIFLLLGGIILWLIIVNLLTKAAITLYNKITTERYINRLKNMIKEKEDLVHEKTKIQKLNSKLYKLSLLIGIIALFVTFIWLLTILTGHSSLFLSKLKQILLIAFIITSFVSMFVEIITDLDYFLEKSNNKSK